MDTSEQYIMMSRAAWGDDESYLPKVGDYAIRYIETGNRVGLVSMNRDKGQESLYWHTLDREDGLTLGEPYTILTRLIPLYRQDQLQDMVPNKGWEDDWNPSQWPLHLAHVLEEYSSAMYDYWQSVPGQPESMEQLWLMFVMQEKHHKTWHDGWTWYNKE